TRGSDRRYISLQTTTSPRCYNRAGAVRRPALVRLVSGEELAEESRMKSPRIVVVEDEPAIRRGVTAALRLSGYEVAEAADGDKGLSEASRADADLVLLDLMLPRKDGLSVLRELRQVRPAVPVIILTARGGEEERVRGLKMGADDYVVKPFSARELLARVEAVLRRSLGPPAGGHRPPPSPPPIPTQP